jgi:uncharacterized protein YlzI (FlbEa/FlbD family)
LTKKRDHHPVYFNPTLIETVTSCSDIGAQVQLRSGKSLLVIESPETIVRLIKESIFNVEQLNILMSVIKEPDD